MSMRRLKRLTNALSKKLANLKHSIAIQFMYYDYARLRQSLKMTPAQKAWNADRAWSIEDLVAPPPGGASN
jgi:hypothetical protein